MLPHPTTSSFPSAMPAKNSGRPLERRMRIIFTDPSGLQLRGIALEHPLHACRELPSFGVLERWSSPGECIALNNAQFLQGGLVAGDDGHVGLAGAFESAGSTESFDRAAVTRYQLAVPGATHPPCSLPFAREGVGGAGDHPVGHRTLGYIAVPSVAQRAGETVGGSERVENQIGMAGVNRELMGKLEVRSGTRVVAQHRLAGSDLHAAHVLEACHPLYIAGMEMRRLAGRGDVSVVVQEYRDGAAEFFEQPAHLALHEVGW